MSLRTSLTILLQASSFDVCRTRAGTTSQPGETMVPNLLCRKHAFSLAAWLMVLPFIHF